MQENNKVVSCQRIIRQYHVSTKCTRKVLYSACATIYTLSTPWLQYSIGQRSSEGQCRETFGFFPSFLNQTPLAFTYVLWFPAKQAEIVCKYLFYISQKFHFFCQLPKVLTVSKLVCVVSNALLFFQIFLSVYKRSFSFSNILYYS